MSWRGDSYLSRGTQRGTLYHVYKRAVPFEAPFFVTLRVKVAPTGPRPSCISSSLIERNLQEPLNRIGKLPLEKNLYCWNFKLLDRKSGFARHSSALTMLLRLAFPVWPFCVRFINVAGFSGK